MDLGRKLCSVTPHDDIENSFPRQPIPYYLAVPDAGVNEDTGLIFFVDGYGGHPSGNYNAKLRPYLANRYNCLVVNLEYFDISVKKHDTSKYTLDDNFIGCFESVYKTKLPDMSAYSDYTVLKSIAQLMAQSGVQVFHPSVRAIYQPEIAYQSFGLLPALDHLSVLSELLNMANINKKRLFILGTSYGGYIATLIGKLSPNTFSMIVDNSGFTEVSEADMVGSGYTYVSFCGCKLAVETKGLWSNEPGTGFLLEKHHREIRDIKNRSHLNRSKTWYYCVHSVDDRLVPIEEKRAFEASRQGVAKVHLEQVNESKVDGVLYKKLDHGMDASLRGIFSNAHAAYLASGFLSDDQTDFDRESAYDFPCSNGYCYNIKFSKDDVKLTLHPPE